MGEVKISQSDLYAARVFFNAALPLLRVTVESKPGLAAKFAGKSFVFQVSALYDSAPNGLPSGAPSGKMATHFVVENGRFTVCVSQVHPNPDIELEFPNLMKFILFFSGKGMPLPKMRGAVRHFGIFAALLQSLLAMAGLLQAKEQPKSAEERALLVKLYFYLLPNGISQLNKAGHPKISQWVRESPDRAYAFSVAGYPELNSYIRIKEGNSKAGRGVYPRCKPFLTLLFDSPEHALDIMMGTGDMIEFISAGFLTVEGAPEFAAVVGEFLFTVGDYAKALYLDGKEAN